MKSKGMRVADSLEKKSAQTSSGPQENDAITLEELLPEVNDRSLYNWSLESLRPDLGHPDHGDHWDYQKGRGQNLEEKGRIYPDGSYEEKYTERDSKFGSLTKRAPEFGSGVAVAEVAQPERLGDAGGFKVRGDPMQSKTKF